MLNTPRKLHFNSDEERELAAQAFLETLFPYIPLRIEFQVMDAIRSYYQKNNIEYSSEQIQKMVELQDVIDNILIDEYLAVRESQSHYNIKLTQLGRDRKPKVSNNYLTDLSKIDFLPAINPIIQPNRVTKQPARNIWKSALNIVTTNPLISTILGGIILFFLLKLIS